MLLKILTYLLGFGALIAVLFGVITLIGWDKVWTRIAGPGDQDAVAFEGLKKKKTPNQALICPEGLCHQPDVDFAAPVYALSAMELRSEILASLEKEERLERVDDQTDPLRLRFVQRTKLMKYPDTIDIQLIELEDGRSTIAAYSRSQLGSSDLGVNRARMKRWLKRLTQFEAA